VVTLLLIVFGKDAIVDPTLLPLLAAHHLATTKEQESVVDPDKSNASPREDVTLLVLADLQFPKESTPSAVKAKSVTERATALSDLQESKLAFVTCISYFLFFIFFVK